MDSNAGQSDIHHQRSGVPALRFGWVLLCMAGCGYIVGGPYDPQIRTVHVPTFTSESFRRGYELELTEAVHREITTRTPFRLSKADRADTRLLGRIIEIRKDVIGETVNDDPRQLQLSIGLEVMWEDLRNGQLIAQRTIPIDDRFRELASESNFTPELGQSLATAKQETMAKLAREIVNLMETPW